MKKIACILMMIILLNGCFFNRRKDRPNEDEIIEELPRDYMIGVFFTGTGDTDKLVKDFEEKTGGKLVFYKPENGYYVFSFKEKTGTEIEDVFKTSKELEYVSNTQIDTEMNEQFSNKKEQTNEPEDEDEDKESWDLPMEE